MLCDVDWSWAAANLLLTETPQITVFAEVIILSYGHWQLFSAHSKSRICLDKTNWPSARLSV